MKYNILLLLLGAFSILSCNECTDSFAYEFIQDDMKAGILNPQTVIFLPLDSVVIIKENKDISISSRYVQVSKWAIDSTDFIYKVKCLGRGEWEILEKETTSRFYKIKGTQYQIQ
ncbi:MAG: hypothetical protein IPN31_09305 [Bacteroidetes bacterium]|nr:hypothetical protein [Bacteroidota bacterium]